MNAEEIVTKALANMCMEFSSCESEGHRDEAVGVLLALSEAGYTLVLTADYERIQEALAD